MMDQIGGSGARALLLSCVIAGALFGAVDAGRALFAGAVLLSAAGLLSIGAFTGLLLGVAASILLLSGDALYRLMRTRAPRPAIDGLLSLVLAVPLGLALFSGRGVSRTWAGALGPYLFPLAAFPIGCALSAGLRRLLSPLPAAAFARRAVAAAAALLLALSFCLADRALYPGLYGYLHVLLAAAALALAALGIWALIPRVPGRYATAGAAGAVLLASLPFLTAFPVPRGDRAIFLEDSLLASRAALVLWHAVDLDGDGYSPLIGGGDCDDLNARLNPHALDLTENGIDEDCDGADPTGVTGLTAASYKMSRAAADRIAAAASRYPTVLVLVDALRRDRLDLAPDRFPNLHRLATESIRFRRAYAHSASTRYSVPAIEAGRVMPRITDPTLPLLLRRAGKRSALVTVDVVPDLMSGLLFGDDAGFPFTRGFDIKEIVATQGRDSSWGGGVEEWTAHEVTDRTLALLDSDDPPDFIWTHYFVLHQWMRVKHAAISAEGLFRYDDVLSLLDAELGRLLERADRVNIVLLSDHGEGFKGLFHSLYLFPEFVKVPLLIRVPGVPPASVTLPVGLSEVLPTILDLTGATEDESMLSRSLLGLVGTEDPGVGPPILMVDDQEWSVAVGRWRLVFRPEGGAVRLYDARNDPLEKRNVAGEHPAVTERLLALVRTMHAQAVARQAVQF